MMQPEDEFTAEDRQYMMLAFDEVCISPVTSALRALKLNNTQLVRALQH